jgi:nitrate reductase gamma subunit
MDLLYTLLYTVFPYLCLTVFVVGHAYRYITDRYNWTARSSQLLESKSLFYGSILFHWGIVLTFFGHAGGMLIPQSMYDMVGISSEVHAAIAYISGIAIGIPAFIGIAMLIWRRKNSSRIRAVTTTNDWITAGGLLFVIAVGLYNVLFGHYNVLYSVAPWIRGIVTFTPDASLMREVPPSFKLHVLSAWALLAFSPFSRLVHIWSIPLTYFGRPYIVYRRQPAGPLPEALSAATAPTGTHQKED